MCNSSSRWQQNTSYCKKEQTAGRFLTTIEGWAGRYPGWALGGGRLDIYTVDIAILIILTIVCYMYTGEKRKKKTFMGSLEYHALELFLYRLIIIKNPLCSLSLNHCFYTGDFFN